MAAWFQRSPEIPRRAFTPAELDFPFTFPVITVADDGTVFAHRTPAEFAIVPEQLVKRGGTPPLRIVDASLCAWRPARLLAVCDTGTRVFGRALFFAEFEYSNAPRLDLETLRATVLDAIARDPDDVWNQTDSHEVVHDRASRARSFAELVEVVAGSGGDAPEHG